MLSWPGWAPDVNDGGHGLAAREVHHEAKEDTKRMTLFVFFVALW
jgi:hypothetical protein